MSEGNPGNHENNGAPFGSRSGVAATIRAALPRRSDLELTPGDAAELAETYRDGLNQYREHSLQYLAVGDYRQAAEKSWGAFALSVKAIAAVHGIRLSHHGHIIRVSGGLASMASQDAPEDGNVLDAGLDAARSLHQHFYENDLPAAQVESSSRRVGAAIDLMQQRFANGRA